MQGRVWGGNNITRERGTRSGPNAGNAGIKNSPQWGQVGRLACPITISFRLSENPSIPEEDQSPEFHKVTPDFYLAFHISGTTQKCT